MTLSELLDRLELKIAASREERSKLIESLQQAQSRKNPATISGQPLGTRKKSVTSQTATTDAISAVEKTPARKRLALGKSLVQLRSQGQSKTASPTPEVSSEPDEPAPARLIALAHFY